MSYRHFYILHFMFYNLSRRMTGFYIFHRLIHVSEHFIISPANPLHFLSLILKAGYHSTSSQSLRCVLSY